MRLSVNSVDVQDVPNRVQERQTLALATVQIELSAFSQPMCITYSRRAIFKLMLWSLRPRAASSTTYTTETPPQAGPQERNIILWQSMAQNKGAPRHGLP